jgi:hypothetical protein
MLREPLEGPMPAIQTGELPQGALLDPYRRQGAYTDCYFMEVPGTVSQPEYVEAFYTSPLFKLERLILALLVSRPSSDAQARQLAAGEATRFAAWNVEGHTANQLLLCDYTQRTRSWLMSIAMENAGPATTRLYFGSAVVPKTHAASGRPSFGLAFHALSGFHRLYSSALLRSAQSRLHRIR